MSFSWRIFGLAACLLVIIPRALANLNEWQVDKGIDCSLNKPCEDMHLDHWDRPTCLVRIQARQRKEPAFAEKYESTDDFFQRLPSGSLANTTDQMRLTLLGCETFCGKGTWYWDAIPRLTTWIIPIVLLLSNIELSPIDKHRFMTVIHAVGDPIDSFWSLLHKIYVWRRLHAIGFDRCEHGTTPQSRWKKRMARYKRWWRRLFRHWGHRLRRAAASLRWPRRKDMRKGKQAADGAKNKRVNSDDSIDDEEEFEDAHDRARVIATVLAGFEEISGAYIESELWYTMVLNRLGNVGNPAKQSSAAWHEWRQCARMLADARTNEFFRTLLAIFIYIFGVLAALDDDIGGGNTSKPGGRIGAAVFLMWLVSLALFSNVVGTFTSRRTCLTIMRLFVTNARRAMEEEKVERDQQDRAKGGSATATAAVSRPEQGPGSLDMPSPAIAGGLSATIATGGGADDGVVQLLYAGSPESSSNVIGSTPETGLAPGYLAPGDLLLNSPLQQAGVQQLNRTRSLSAGPPIRRPGATASLGDTGSGNDIELEVQHPGQQEQQQYRRRQGHWFQTSVDYLNVDPKDTNVGYASIDFATSSVSDRSWSRSDVGKSGSTRALLLPSTNAKIDISSSQTPPSFRDFRFPRSGEGGEPSSPGGRRGGAQQQKRLKEVGITPLMDIETWAEYFSSLHWLGAVYTYRPWKIGYRSVHRASAAHYASNGLLYTMSLFPIIVGAIGAFIIMWYAVPIGWSCRHVWVVGLTVVWMLSNLFTVWLHNDKIPAKEIYSNEVGEPGGSGNDSDTGVSGSLDPSPNQSEGAGEGGIVADGPECGVDKSSHGGKGSVFKLACGICGSIWRFIIGKGTWSERRRWYVLLLKDTLVGLGGLAVVFLSTTGVFNNCWCWSAYMWHRWLPGNWGREAFVPLNTDEEYTFRADTVYGRVVWGCLIFQLVFFFGIVFLWWDGITVVRWNESGRRREWRHEVLRPGDLGTGGNIDYYDEANYLLFCFNEHEFADEMRKHRRRRSTFTSTTGSVASPRPTPRDTNSGGQPAPGRRRGQGSEAEQDDDGQATESNGRRPARARSASSVFRLSPQERSQTSKLERGE